jgi:hypothetical protein
MANKMKARTDKKKAGIVTDEARRGLMVEKSIHYNNPCKQKPNSNVWSGKPAKEMAQPCTQQPLVIFERK